MENTDRIWQESGKETFSPPVICTNRLRVANEIRGKPGRIDSIGLEFAKEFFVVDHVKAFLQIK